MSKPWMRLSRWSAGAAAVMTLGLGFAGDLRDAIAQESKPVSTAEKDPEANPEGRKTYFGRRIARTMHWAGAEWLMRESRADEEDSARLLEALDLEQGWTVCDLGCGNGYYSLPMSGAVGATGKVLAVDIQQEMLDLLGVRAAAAECNNIELVLGTLSDPRLEPRSCDLILMVDVYHELSHPVSVLKRVREALKPEGRLVLVEFRAEDPEVPIKKLHKMSKAQVLLEMSANGLRFAEEYDGLPWQHLVAFERDPDFPREEGQVLAEGRAVALGLWRAVLAGDTLSMRGFYAEQVYAQAGSELLKSEWGGAGEAASVGRKDWLERYVAALDKVGRDTWREALEAQEVEVERPGALGFWADAREDDLLLLVGESNDPLIWHLRRDDPGRWAVVSERTDY